MKTMKAISPVVATVLLILIAVAASILIYAWITGWTGKTAGGLKEPEGQLVVEEAYTLDNTDPDNDTNPEDAVILYVANYGKAPVQLHRVYVTLHNRTVIAITEVTSTTNITKIEEPKAVVKGNDTVLEVGEVAELWILLPETAFNPDQIIDVNIRAKDGSYVTITLRT